MKNQSLLLSIHEQNDIKQLIHKEVDGEGNEMLESFIKNSDGFETMNTYNAQLAKISYQKFLFFRNTAGYLCLLSFIFSLTTFSLNYHLDEGDSAVNIFMMVMGLVFKCFLVIIYIYSVRKYGDFLKAIGKLKDSDDYFKEEGYVYIYFKALVLFISPLFFLRGYQVDVEEYYWNTDNSYVFFSRDINHYLYIIQFTVQFWFIFFITFQNSVWAKTRSNRICNMFGFDNDIIFIIKCILSTQGIRFVFIIVLSGMFFFSTLINVSEIGYYLYIKDDASVAASDIKDSQVLIFYYNTFWNMLVTMTTIGYGDMYVRTNLSRVIIFFVAVYGAVILPLLIVSITNLFEINKQEKVVMKIMEMINIKKELQKQAVPIIILALRLNKLLKDEKQIENVFKQRNLMNQKLKKFSLLKTRYDNLQASNQIQDLAAKMEQIDNKFTIMTQHFLQYIYPKTELNNQILMGNSLEKNHIKKYVDKEIKKITKDNYLNIKQIMQFQVPNLSINTRHLGLLYYLDDDKTGKFGQQKIVRAWGKLKDICEKYRNYELCFQLLSYCSGILLGDLKKSGKMVGKWLVVCLKEVDKNVLVVGEMEYVKFEFIECLYDLFNVKGIQEISLQELFYLMQQAGEERNLLDIGCKELDCFVPMGIVEDFILGFLKGMGGLYRELEGN